MPRHISDKLFDEFDTRLQNVNQARNCISQKNARGLLVEAARSMINLEEDGDNRGAEINLMHEVGGSSPGDPWCMSFVQSCLAYVEKKLGVVSPAARGAQCTAVWFQTEAAQRTKTYPLGGAIAVWQSIHDPNKGHTGIVIDCDGNTMHTVEGNAAPQVHLHDGIEREGDSVYLFHRPWDIFNADKRGLKLLGALRPF
jgi:hypothetical protein